MQLERKYLGYHINFCSRVIHRGLNQGFPCFPLFSDAQYLIQTACSPVSPVRMRTMLSTALTKIFPSPILPVLAALTIASTAEAACASASTTSIFTLGRKSTVYSLPR